MLATGRRKPLTVRHTAWKIASHNQEISNLKVFTWHGVIFLTHICKTQFLEFLLKTLNSSSRGGEDSSF
jgi:hypothetical protein